MSSPCYTDYQRGWVIYSRSPSWLKRNHRAPQSSHKAVSKAASPDLECPFATREFRQLKPRGQNGWSSSFYPFPGYRQGCSSQKYRRIESILRSGCLSLLHPQYIRMFLFNENNKTILQGKKNRRLNSFLLLSVHFLERAPESSWVGVGQFQPQA